jgi:hypothetical protein
VFPTALAATARLLARSRRTVFDTVAPADEALMLAVAVLRHAGARITRYEVEAGALEARLTRWGREGLVRVSAAGEAPTRVTVESDVVGGRAIERWLRTELTRTRRWER